MNKEDISKHIQIDLLFFRVSDPMVLKFFDIDSDAMLDEKIEVLKALAAGAAPGDIPNYYDVLELYPKDSDMPWDL